MSKFKVLHFGRDGNSDPYKGLNVNVIHSGLDGISSIGEIDPDLVVVESYRDNGECAVGLVADATKEKGIDTLVLTHNPTESERIFDVMNRDSGWYEKKLRVSCPAKFVTKISRRLGIDGYDIVEDPKREMDVIYFGDEPIASLGNKINYPLTAYQDCNDLKRHDNVASIVVIEGGFDRYDDTTELQIAKSLITEVQSNEFLRHAKIIYFGENREENLAAILSATYDNLICVPRSDFGGDILATKINQEVAKMDIYK